MLREKMKGILQSYLIFVIIYLILFLISPYIFKGGFIVINIPIFLAVTASYSISLFITYLQNKNK